MMLRSQPSYHSDQKGAYFRHRIWQGPGGWVTGTAAGQQPISRRPRAVGSTDAMRDLCDASHEADLIKHRLLTGARRPARWLCSGTLPGGCSGAEGPAQMMIPK